MGLFDGYYDPDQFEASGGLLGRLLSLQRQLLYPDIDLATSSYQRSSWFGNFLDMPLSRSYVHALLWPPGTKLYYSGNLVDLPKAQRQSAEKV